MKTPLGRWLSRFLTLCASCFIAAQSQADTGDLFIQVSDSSSDCSIMRVPLSGVAAEWITDSDIDSETGGADCDNDGLVVTPDGDLYFTVSSPFALLHADANSSSPTLTTLLNESDLATALGVTVSDDPDLENGLAWMDGVLYSTADAGDSACVDDSNIAAACDSLVSITNLGGSAQINVLANDSTIAGITGSHGVNLPGGVAVDSAGKVYFVADGHGSDAEGVYSYDINTGALSQLLSEADLLALPGVATSSNDTDLDLDIALNGSQLIILDDEDDYIFRHNLRTNGTEVFITEQEIVDGLHGAGSYVDGDTSGATTDMEGGMAVGPDGSIYLADDGAKTTGSSGTDETDDIPTVIKITPSKAVQAYVTSAAIHTLYGYTFDSSGTGSGSFEPQFRAGTDMQLTRSQFNNLTAGSYLPPQATEPVPALPLPLLWLLVLSTAVFSARKLRHLD